jgi:ATP-binding cassette subfamily C exporter for protease/lipase
MHETISALAEGYDTLIGENGTIFSGGQRQRIALARAIYGEPKLVVLDEPNSHLDEAGDTVLVDAILALKKKGTTFVLVTHRTSLFKVVDKILLLNEGQTQLVGNKDEVLAAMAPKTASPAPARTSPSSMPGPAAVSTRPT